MLEPDERMSYGCRTCRDVGRVAVGLAEKPCPDCSGWDEDRRGMALTVDLARRGEKPILRMGDLSAAELAVVGEWQELFPRASDLTLLLWIEGRRYRPSEDAEFLALVRRRLAKWQFHRDGAHEGVVPSRLRHALATGETKHLTDGERERLAVLREGKEAA